MKCFVLETSITMQYYITALVVQKCQLVPACNRVNLSV